jgi:hypothetical protein
MNLAAAYYVHRHVVPAALALLPAQMTSHAAHAMLLAIGMQESNFDERVQLPNGPAHGYWQFERAGGVREVLTGSTRAYLVPVLTTLNYPPDESILYAAITHNDVLACIFARLLLWTVPSTLPLESQSDRAWRQYVGSWRPGKPHREPWPARYEEAWRMVLEE